MNRDEALTETAMEVSPKQWGEDSTIHYREFEFGWNEYQQRRQELINCPPDSKAPEWAEWKAQDGDGEWFWYSDKPCIRGRYWQHYDGYVCNETTGKIPVGHCWQDTLREVNQDTSQNEPVMSRNDPQYDPRDVAFNREMNPPTSSLTDSQAREYAVESGLCSDGTQCGTLAETAYCDDCPNAPHAQDARRLDEQLREAVQFGKVAPTANDILNAAVQHMQDRAATYDKPEGERSMAATVEAFRATTGIEMSETDGWLFMCLLKIVRSRQGEYRADNFEDLAAYSCLAGESAAKESSE